MVVVFNFGGQYAHLIARRIRQLGVKSELVAPSIQVSTLKKLKPDAIIFSGSPFSAFEKNAPKVDPAVYELGIPILGICYGMQLIANQLGGKVINRESKQFGKVKARFAKSKLFEGLSQEEAVWFSHGDAVDKMPSGFQVIAQTSSVKIAGFQNGQKNIFGIQFHPEVTHTPNGMKILENFLFKISKAKKDWNLDKLKTQIISELKKEIGNKKVLMALSGGVDSLVAATLIKEAIGNNLRLVFIDTGLLRSYDLSDLGNVIKRTNLTKLKIVRADKIFLKALRGIVEPEDKRKVIAKHYFEILEIEAKKIGANFLGQGTIYPDRVESASTSSHTDKIKSHHNVTLPHGLKLKVVEPLAEFYKDEVRAIGKILKIPDDFLMRHPFPGPGLAIRILGEVTDERLEILRASDEIFISELKAFLICSKTAQALAALLPVKSVGVMGDARTYSYIIALRSVDTVDFMTADWSKLSNDLLEKVSSRIVNEVRGVNRVVYDITQKPPATIEYE